MPGPSAKAGIGQGIANIGRIISRRGDRDLEREREQERQDRLRALTRLQYGVRPGEAPTRGRTIRPPDLPEPETDFAPPEGPLMGGDTGGVGLRADAEEVVGSAGLDAPPVPTATIREPDPGFTEVPELGGYVMTPEEERRRETEREREERERMVGAIGRAITEGASSEDRARGVLAGAPSSILTPEEEKGPDWQVRNVGDRPYRLDPETGAAEPFTGLPEPDVDEGAIRVRGREFPDTPAGRREAEAWTRRMAAAGRTTGDDEFTRLMREVLRDRRSGDDEEGSSVGDRLSGAVGAARGFARGAGNALLPGQPFGSEEAAAEEPRGVDPGSYRHVDPESGDADRRDQQIFPEPEVDLEPEEEVGSTPSPVDDVGGLEPGSQQSLDLETDIRDARQEGQTDEQIMSGLREGIENGVANGRISRETADARLRRAKEILSRLESDNPGPSGNPGNDNPGNSDYDY